MLTDEAITAAELRARAEAALAEGRHEDALVDGFRALAVRQVERGRLDDTPGATAHEVAGVLAREYPDRGPRVDTRRARSSTPCCTATGRPPASRRSTCSPSTTTWRGCDDTARLWRRHRATLLIVGGFVLAVVVVIWSTGGGQENDVRFDPANPGPDGAQAVARVLDDQGVDVHVARSADALDDEEVGAGTTVLVTSTEQLGDSTLTGCSSTPATPGWCSPSRARWSPASSASAASRRRTASATAATPAATTRCSRG